MLAYYITITCQLFCKLHDVLSLTTRKHVDTIPTSEASEHKRETAMKKRNSATTVMVQPGLTVNAATLAVLYCISINEVKQWCERGMPSFAYGKGARRFSTTAVNEWIEKESKRRGKSKQTKQTKQSNADNAPGLHSEHG
jgi:hypothetical protein